MPDAVISPAVAVILFGLLASIGWGVGDFGGGLTSRLAPVLGVLMWSQVASLVVAVPILAVAGEPSMAPSDLAIALVGGVLSASGLALLYRGLAVGRMGVVAPVAAILTATLPIGFGFITEGIPSVFAIVGIGFAVVSVALVSRSPSTADGRPSGLPYAIGAGVLFAAFAIGATQLNEGLIVTPVVVIRFASVAFAAAWILARRQPWRVPRRLWPAILFVGVSDLSATAAYLSSIAIGPLAIAASLASLYPVVTAVLAAVLLRERMTPGHAVGILAAGVAVVLIAGASAG